MCLESKESHSVPPGKCPCKKRQHSVQVASTPGGGALGNLGGYFWKLGFGEGKPEGSLWGASLG